MAAEVVIVVVVAVVVVVVAGPPQILGITFVRISQISQF